MAVVLDPAHGGDRDVGKSTCLGLSAGFVPEKQRTLALCELVRSQVGSDVVLTRSGDYNLSLADRISRARGSGAQAFVSVHADPGDQSEVFVHDAADSRSRGLAQRVGSQLGIPVRSACLAVLDPHAHAGTPAVMVNVGAGSGDEVLPAAVRGLGFELAALIRGLRSEALVRTLQVHTNVSYPVRVDGHYAADIAALRHFLNTGALGANDAFLVVVDVYGQPVTLVMSFSDLYVVGFYDQAGRPHAVEEDLVIAGSTIKPAFKGDHGTLGTEKSSFSTAGLAGQIGSLLHPKDQSAEKTALGVLVALTAEAARFHPVEAAFVGAIQHHSELPLAPLMDYFKNWQKLTTEKSAAVAVPQGRRVGAAPAAAAGRKKGKAKSLALNIDWSSPDKARKTIEASNPPVVVAASGAGPVFAIHGLDFSELSEDMQELAYAIIKTHNVLDQATPHTNTTDNTLGAMRSYHMNQYRHLPVIAPHTNNVRNDNAALSALAEKKGPKAQATFRYARAFKMPKDVETGGRVAAYVEYSLGHTLGAHGRFCYDVLNNRLYLTTRHYGVWDKTRDEHAGQDITTNPGRYASPWLCITNIQEPARPRLSFMSYSARDFTPRRLVVSSLGHGGGWRPANALEHATTLARGKKSTVKFKPVARPGVGPGLVTPALAGMGAWNHILGQRLMQLLFFIAQNSTSYKESLRDQRIRLVADWDDVGWANPARNKLAEFVWSPLNLFEGPSSEYRLFDPSSGVEQVRPRGFPEERWNLWKGLAATLLKYVGEPKLRTMLADKQIEFEIVDDLQKEVMTAFAKLAQTVPARSKFLQQRYAFQAADWAIVNLAKMPATAPNPPGVNPAGYLALAKRSGAIEGTLADVQRKPRRWKAGLKS